MSEYIAGQSNKLDCSLREKSLVAADEAIPLSTQLNMESMILTDPYPKLHYEMDIQLSGKEKRRLRRAQERKNKGASKFRKQIEHLASKGMSLTSKYKSNL